MEILYLFICFIASILITPIVKKIACKYKILDKPNQRKVHTKLIPRLGGLAIFISFLIGLAIYRPADPHIIYLLAGGSVIILTGVLDDIFELSAKVKLIGQLVAAIIAVVGGFQLEFINLPFGGEMEFGFLTVPLTIVWIVGITNAINLIDGLDGLAAGVSTIALVTLGIMAAMMGDVFVLTISLILIGSTLGFLVYNFYPAKIFMGDTGALFLGYMIALLSLLGFKNVTFFSLIIPVIILGVPISDTLFAMVRRFVQKRSIVAPDRQHLHHRLLNLGFSHRQSVLVIYAIAIMFSLAAVIFSMATVWGSLFILAIVLFALELLVETIGLVGHQYRPLLKMLGIRDGEKIRYK